MSKQLLVFGYKTFKITVPDDAKITFGPWSPPSGEGKYSMSDKALSGTLRIYENHKAGSSILAVFSGVSGYRDLSMGYAEQVAREEGAVIWKDDEEGYVREDKIKREKAWITPALPSGDDE